MRTAARTDANHTEIIEALRRSGCTVQSLASVGKGCPDIAVGVRGMNYFLEIKDGSKPPSKRKLTPEELVWHSTWRGQVVTVESVEQALKAVGVAR